MLPLTDKQIAAAQDDRRASCATQDFRVAVDERSEKIGAKIRDAQMQKIPYMLILGGREVENGTVSVRSRVAGDQGAMTLEDFLVQIEAERRVELT